MDYPLKHNTINEETRKPLMNVILLSLVKKDPTGYLALIYFLLELSEEISRS